MKRVPGSTFKEIVDQVLEAESVQDEQRRSEHMRSWAMELDKLAAKLGGVHGGVPARNIIGGGGNPPASDGGGNSLLPDFGTPAAILSGHAVVAGSMLYFSGGAVGLADASNPDRMADAYCTKTEKVNGVARAWWRDSGQMALVKLATGETGLTQGTALYLSSESPGSLSSNADQENSAFQYCARFVRLATNQSGTVIPGMAVANVNISRPASLPSSA